MSEKIASYEVEVGFDTALRKLQDFERKMGAFSNKEQKSSSTNKKMMNAHHKEREKHLNKEYASKIKKEADFSAAHIAAIKQNIKFDKKAAEARDKAGIAPKATSRINNNNAHVKAREAELNRQARTEARRSTNLSSARDTFQRSGLNLKAATTEQERLAQAALRESIAKAKTAKEVRLLIGMERERLRVMKQSERSMNKQSFIMQRMTASSKQFAGNMVSAFAVAGLGVGIAKVGMQMEGIDSALLAVSGSAKLATSDINFIKEESMRLGKPLKESADAFVKMNAARGNLSREQIRYTFTAIQETATVLGLTADEANRGNIAISQMMSKGKVTAEELKNQLAEAGFANAIPEMVKAAQDIGLIDKNMGLVEATARFYKLQEQGKIITEEILPAFSKRMKDFASGGLEDKLGGVTVKLGQLMNAITLTADLVFKSGFDKGLSEVLDSFMVAIVELSPLWESLGKIIGSVFSLISDGVKWVTPILISLSNVLKSITDSMGSGREYLLAMVGPAAWIGKIFGGVSLRVVPIVGQFILMLDLIKEMAFWAEELDNLLFSQNKIGVLYDPREGKNNDTKGKVSKFMLGAADNTNLGVGDSIMKSLMTIMSGGNTGQVVSSGIGSAINAGAFIGKSFSMTGVVNIDGQKVGEVAAKSDAVKDVIQSEIRGVQQ